MSFCEKCGSSLEQDVFFCPECGSSTRTPKSHTDEIAQIKKQNQNRDPTQKSPPLFTKNRGKTYPSMSPGLYYALFLLGGVMVIIGISLLVGDFPSLPQIPTIPRIPPLPAFSGSIFLPIGLTILGLAMVYLVARESSRDPIVFWIISIFILTIGLSITIPTIAEIVLPIGITIIGFLIIYLYSRHSTHPHGYYIVFYIVTFMIGLSLVIPSAVEIIFSAGLIGGGLAICISILKTPIRPVGASQ